MLPVAEKEAKKAQERLDAAQDPKLPLPPSDAVVIPRGEWHDLPAKKLLEAVAYANTANWTGELGWFKGAQPFGGKLKAITTGFCDNIVLKCLVPPEHVIKDDSGDGRKNKYLYVDVRCKTIREIVAAAGLAIAPDDVKPIRMVSLAKLAKNSRRRGLPSPHAINHATVINRGENPPPVAPDDWTYCFFKVAFADCDMQAVINLVRSGAFARHGLWLNDFDVTIDCAGVVSCKDLKEHFLQNCSHFYLEGHKFTSDDFDEDGWPANEQCRIVLDNACKVGNNCLTWIQMDASGVLVRAKVYVKLVQEFETKAVRDKCGNHIHDWIEASGTRLAAARDDTRASGLMRSESSIYYDMPHIKVEDAHLELPTTAEEMTQFAEIQVDVVPSHLVLAAPHSLSIAQCARNIKHTLLVVDLYNDCCLICVGKNEVTGVVSGTHISEFKRRRQHILQKCTLGNHPIDVIWLHRGSAHKAVKQTIPEPKSASERANKLHVDAKANANWVDRDMDWEVGAKRKAAEAVEEETTEEEDNDVQDAPPQYDYGDDDDDAEDGEMLDKDAAIARALREEQERMATELASAADTASTVDQNELRCKVAPGSIAVTTSRFHRVPVDPDVPNPTEFPPNGRVEAYFHLPEEHMPELLPIDKTAATDAGRKANRAAAATNASRIAVATQEFLENVRLPNAGFRPLDSMRSFRAVPRYAHTPVSNKLRDAYIMDCTSKLTIVTGLDLNSILGAQKRQSFCLNQQQLKSRVVRKQHLFKARQEIRAKDLKTAAAERKDMVQKASKRTAIIDLKQNLRAACDKKAPQSLNLLAAGEYQLVAIEKKKGISTLYVQTESTLEAYKGKQLLDDALVEKKDEIARFYNDIGDGEHDSVKAGTFYLYPSLTRKPIGAINVSTYKGQNGKQVADLGVTIGGTLILLSQAQKREMDAASTPSETGKPPLLTISPDLSRNTKEYIDDVCKLKNGDPPRALRVLKLGTTKHFNHDDSAMLEVKEGDKPSVIVWGGRSLNDKLSEFTTGCYIVIHKCLAKHGLDAEIIPADRFGWLSLVPRKYASISPIRKGTFPSQPTSIKIKEAGTMPGMDHPIIMDADGVFWRFQSPQTVKANPKRNMQGLTLTPGHVLDTATFTVKAP